MRKILTCTLLLLATALPAAGQLTTVLSPLNGITSWTVTGDLVKLVVSLPGGLGGDLSLLFEDATSLNLLSLGISARLVNPNDPALLARMPSGVTPGLPVLLRIEPPPIGGLTFRGITTLEIHTLNLHYTTGCPLRLFSAPLGGPFKDITTSMGAGSYRVRGSSGGFSEFLIVADTRPVDQVITDKLNRLEQMLDGYTASVPGSLYDDLEERLEEIRADYTQGDFAGAIEGVDGFLAVVQQNAGTAIPNVWRAARDLQNVAGYLRGAAMTLRLSLALKNGSGS